MSINSGFDRKQHIYILKIFKDIKTLNAMKLLDVGIQIKLAADIFVRNSEMQNDLVYLTAVIIQFDRFADLIITLYYVCISASSRGK